MTSRATAFYDAGDPARWGRESQPDALDVTRRWRERAHPPAGVIVEIGCGRGPLVDVGTPYVGFDLALGALVAGKGVGARVNGDMESLPFRSDSVSFIFSWAALEHTPNPEVVLREVERVLRPGGVAVLAPAWHCRPWAAEGLEFLPYAALQPGQKLRKALIPLRSSVLWRAPFEVLSRIAGEMSMLSGGPRPFRYRRLSPNLNEYVGTDCDAFTSMDPHAMILYFASRGWEVLSHPTLRSRMLARNEPVVARKPRPRDQNRS